MGKVGLPPEFPFDSLVTRPSGAATKDSRFARLSVLAGTGGITCWSLAINEIAQGSEASPRLFGLERRRLGGWGLLIVLLLVAVRVLAEMGMMRAHGPDAQMAIWWVLCAFKATLWFIGGGIALAIMLRLWRYRWGRTIGAALLLIWAVAIGWASWQYDVGARALTDASDVKASPERLRELVHFDGIQAGYELDNRLAANPSTPPDVLRELAAKPDQLGTQMVLERNPRTSADVREKLDVKQ